MMQKDIDKMFPQVADNEKQHGEVIWIKDQISEQNKKMRTMFNVLSKLAENRKQ